MARLTLEEIGRMAGVSRSTVSRVINGQPGVSDDAKARVLEIIDETGFRPNSAARSLVSNRTGVLGLVIPSSVQNLFADPYFGTLIQGITRAANAAEQTLSLFLFENEREEVEMYPRVIANGILDGLIVTATKMDDPLVERMVSAGTNFVMVGRPDRHAIPSVDVSNRSGAHEATTHLIEHGYSDIALIAAPSNSTTGIDRRLGFLDAMADAGRDVPSERIAEGDFTERGGHQAMIDLLRSRPRGVFCASDSMAIGAIQAISEAGLDCPGDIAVVGFDDLVQPRQGPGLTTVAQPVRQTGEEAVSLLLDVIEAESAPESRVLPTELRIRTSCGCSEESDRPM